MIRWTASVSRRIGDSADCVASQPPVSAMTTTNRVTMPERGAEARQQIVARLGALADLHEGAVAQPRRHDLDLRRVPAFVVAEHHRLDAAVDDAHEQPLRRDLLLGAHGGRQNADAAAQVGRGVVAELAVDDLMIALGQRRRRQVVGDEDDRDGAGHEQRRVPQRQPQAEKGSIGTEDIAHATHRVQQLRLERPIDLLAQPADQHVDDVGLRDRSCTPRRATGSSSSRRRGRRGASGTRAA